tara:strand:+ start:498 stop:650 length:153 start_codon:yes stop_codon:yes gene_type:complete
MLLVDCLYELGVATLLPSSRSKALGAELVVYAVSVAIFLFLMHYCCTGFS